ETLQAIARAFNVRESVVTVVAFEAMGYDLATVRLEADLSTATDAQLVRALADRLGVGLDSEDGEDHDTAPNTRAADGRSGVPDEARLARELLETDLEEQRRRREVKSKRPRPLR